MSVAANAGAAAALLAARHGASNSPDPTVGLVFVGVIFGGIILLFILQLIWEYVCKKFGWEE